MYKGGYRSRQPETTDYYRIIEGSYERFEGVYDEHCLEYWGYLRPKVMQAINAYLDCGIAESGMARVMCEKCGANHFVCFSCRQRGICSSCTTKRSLLFGEKVVEMIKEVKHIHVTFTIPKILRGYVRRNRKLLKVLVASCHYAVNAYFIESLKIAGSYSGGIYYVQTYGNQFNYHPHVHALVMAGVVKGDRFYEQKDISTRLIGEIMRARLLSELKRAGVIADEMVELLMSWNHCSGFNVYAEGRIEGHDSEGIENVARYMSRAAISVDRVAYDSEAEEVIVYEDQARSAGGEIKKYSVLEFMALLSSHIPSPYEPLVYYYGVYSSAYRGKEAKEENERSELSVKEVKGQKAMDGGRVISTWARLIQRIFEVDPLTCQRCGCYLICFDAEHDRKSANNPKHLTIKALKAHNFIVLS